MSFSNEKMKERTKFCSKNDDLSSLHETVGKDVLPEEYGGTNGKMKTHIGMYAQVNLNKIPRD